jgi:hypothetical protein
MRIRLWFISVAILLPLQLHARPDASVVVFWQPGFPTVASQPVEQECLVKALDGPGRADERSPEFVGEDGLAAAVTDADLLVLPYGSAVPVKVWKTIQHYIETGGNLLVIGGEPLRVPVSLENGKYVAGAEQDTYARAVGFRHEYEVPVAAGATFQWRRGYDWLPKLAVQGKRFFAVEGRLSGLGYMADSEGQQTAAPVIVSERAGHRFVALDFEPAVGYWESADGIALIREAAGYARQGATELSVETLFSAIRPGEPPLITIHLQLPEKKNSSAAVSSAAISKSVRLQLASEKGVVAAATLPLTGAGSMTLDAPFSQPLPQGMYTVTAVYSEGPRQLEFAQNGFLVEERSALTAGPALGVKRDFLTLGGKTYFPVGTNYFTTEEDGWDFSGPRNVAVWDRDFAEMAAHGVNFVRTGVWMPNGRFIDGDNRANERFLRNVEAFLACAHRHNIAVNFTFFAFAPHSGPAPWTPDPSASSPNPYTDAGQVWAQKAYVRSVVERFKDVPWLSWDLINEPSFANPRHIFSGNYPNGDATETAAWHKWLASKYPSVVALADAWRVPVETLANFDAVPLPSLADLRSERYGNANLVRAVDYNLFAQDMFSEWVKGMVALIRGAGSTQLINVGQDEGGVTDRVLNQFYGGAGVSFTTNHTYWQDDALLWDSIAARRQGVPNITGETGYQPAWSPDGSWRWDELTGQGLTERKWALGFAAGSSGALQWDWAREADFGMQRSDGSAKVWENMMRDLGAFATAAAPWADAMQEPETALVLPQSLQLSVQNSLALEAQQAAVRALYHYARGEAYAVGEYQPELLGEPKLILLPSPMGLTNEAWAAIEKRVRAGAVLLVTGPFAGDAHLHDTGRQDAVGLAYAQELLTLRDMPFHFPGGDEQLSFGGQKTNLLSRASLPGGGEWVEKPLGKGRILFATLPLELNGNLQAVGDVYRYALKTAQIAPVYTTTVKDPGILICPTVFAKATLYVLTSETETGTVAFTDLRSGKKMEGTLAAGRAALLLVGTDGKVLAAYHWKER